MAINEKDLEKIASLAKLKLQPEDKPRLLRDLNKILDYMEIINDIDLNEMSPESRPQNEGTILRDDKVRESVDRDDALRNASVKKDNLIGVPKVIKPSK